MQTFLLCLDREKVHPRRKPTKNEKAEWAAATTIPSKPKVAKQDTTQEETTEPSEEDTTTIDINSDSLPDPFAPKEMTPKMFSTKEDQSADNIQEEMDTMPEFISDDDNNATLKSFTTKDLTEIPKTSHHQPKKFTTRKPPPIAMPQITLHLYHCTLSF